MILVYLGLIVIGLLVLSLPLMKYMAKKKRNENSEEFLEDQLDDWQWGTQCPQCKHIEHNRGRCLVLIGLCPYCSYFGEYILVKYRCKLINVTLIKPEETAVYSVCAYCNEPIVDCVCDLNK